MSILNINTEQANNQVSQIIERSTEIFNRSTLKMCYGTDETFLPDKNQSIITCSIISFLIRDELYHTISFQKNTVCELVNQSTKESQQEFLMQYIRKILAGTLFNYDSTYQVKLYGGASVFNTTDSGRLYELLNNDGILKMISHIYITYRGIPKESLYRINMFSWPVNSFPRAARILNTFQTINGEHFVTL